MEENLLDLMRARGGIFTVNEALTLVYHILSGLDHIHSHGLIHRDLKPENCFVNSQTLDLKIGDFGSACEAEDRHLSEYVATRWYRPPEVILTPGVYGTAIDVWAAGCILAELLNGRPLFPGKDATDQIDAIHRVLGSPTPEVLAKMCGSHIARNEEMPKRIGEKLEDVVETTDPEVIELLRGMLAYVPGERLSAAAALQHPAFHAVGLRPLINARPGDTLQPRRAAIQVPIVLPGRIGIVASKSRKGLGSPPRNAPTQVSMRSVAAGKIRLQMGTVTGVKFRL
jgi:serine/threonine protein kinase